MHGMKSRLKEFAVMCILLFCIGVISAQVSKYSIKQPQPSFRIDSQDRDSILSFATKQPTVIRAVSVCAVWNIPDTVERMLWSISDSSGKVAAHAGGKAVCSAGGYIAGLPQVRTDIAGLPRKMRKTALTFTIVGDSIRRDTLLECLFYPYALSQPQRIVAESYLALKYGVTLREDYLSPEGDTLWNYGTDSLFSHAVAGLGCDTLHGLQRVEGVSAESGLIHMKLQSASNNTIINNNVSLLPGQYLLWGESEGELSFGAGSAFSLLGDSIVLFDLMERIWLVRTTGTSGSLTSISVAADSLPQTDSLWLLLDRSGKGVFDGAECHGPARADSSGLFTFMVCWDNDHSGTDMFTFARAGLPEHQMSVLPKGTGYGEAWDSGASTGIRHAESAKTAVWPNPVSETLHVQSGMAAPVEAFVTDSHGKLLLRHSFAQSDFGLNVSGLSTGSYTLQLRNEEGSKSISIVVKRAR